MDAARNLIDPTYRASRRLISTALLLTATWAFTIHVVNGQAIAIDKVLAEFIDQPPRQGRGPSRSIFKGPAAKLLSQQILDEHCSELRKQLSTDTIDELGRRVFRISIFGTARKSRDSALEAIDLWDQQYELALADAFPAKERERLAVAFLHLDGLSAIRRPIVAGVLDVDDMTRKKVQKSVSPTWDKAVSLNRALWEGDLKEEERKAIDDGLRFLSKEADLAALRTLHAEQRERLAELLKKIPSRPKQLQKGKTTKTIEE